MSRPNLPQLSATAVKSPITMGTSFAEWLDGEMARRRISQAELARRGGISQAAISLVLKRKRQAGPDLCSAVARALGLPESQVFRAAGLLPPNREINPTAEAIMHDLGDMTEEQTDEIRLIVRAHKEAWERQNARRNKERPRRAE